MYEDMDVGNVVDGDHRKWRETTEKEEEKEYAWDDVNDMLLPIDLIRKARREEMAHLKEKHVKVLVKSEAWEVTGKATISTEVFDTDKTHGTGEVVRSRRVARDFKDPSDKEREDLLTATPPNEMMRYMFSRKATRWMDGKERKTMYHAPRCE